MLLGISIGLVNRDGLFDFPRAFHAARQVVSGGWFPERQLRFIQHSFLKPTLCGLVAGIIVLNQADPIGGGPFAASHHRLGLCDLPLKGLFVDTEISANPICSLQIDVNVQIFDLEFGSPLHR